MSKVFKIAVAVALMFSFVCQGRPDTYRPRPEFGYPAGLVPNCPGVLKNVTISPRMMKEFLITIHQITNTGQIIQKKSQIDTAHKMVAWEKTVDLKNKKTVVYTVGFLDSSSLVHSQAIATAYAKRGYNVFVSDTNAILKYIFPKSVRLVRIVGKKIGEFLVKLTEFGLQADNIELVGISLGAHVAAHAAKYFYQATGRKVGRLTGLDPAGPCFKELSPENKLYRTDADKVDVIHTNIDGFGTAETLGHLDIYVNGGEFQPSDIPYIPCLIVCSHVRALIYWWQAIEHPKKFIAIKCDTVQEARFAQCFNNSQTNYLGLEAKFDRPGIYYLATDNEFPYFKGKDGLIEKNEVYKKFAASINSDDFFVV